nr:EOG090X017M [Polyphemus pediculus]
MSLASKCMEPAFRMHLRAHSTVAKFFQALKDAPSKASVALCTSCIMFVLTQDRLNMDLDRDSLELMLNLLEIDTGIGQVDIVEVKELEKNKLKVRELCEEMVRKGHAPHLQLDKITAAQLAMETLLSLTSKKAGEWFKEELRVLGGLDHIIQTVTLCTTALTTPYGDPAQSILQWNWDKLRLDALKKVDRCLRVLENVTFQNEENQNYLLEYSDGRLVDATLKLLELLAREVIAYSPPVSKDSLGHLLSEALTNLMKVIMNLTHDSNDDSLGSRAYGENPLTWQTALTCLLNTSPCLPEEKRFDVTTLSLGILINLVERSVANREKLLAAPVPYGSDEVFGQKVTSLSALINLFIAKEESARLEEARTDEILDGKPPTGANGGNSSQSLNSGNNDNPSNANNKQEDAMEETVKKLLHKAGRHMEDSMVAAYVGLLIGYIVMKNKDYELKVKELLPNQKFTMMIVVLKKFYEFLKLTANAVTSTRGLKNTELVIKFMEASDKSSSAVPKEETCSSLSDDDDM